MSLSPGKREKKSFCSNGTLSLVLLKATANKEATNKVVNASVKILKFLVSGLLKNTLRRHNIKSMLLLILILRRYD